MAAAPPPPPPPPPAPSGLGPLLPPGSGRAHALADFLLGSIAQRVLCWATADVLVVPGERREDAPPVVVSRKLREAR